ncbi:hypothetical protein [Caenimonas sp. SL110]|uniref:hypothetical protein n=1 Tax=Caenimonas sp. SL110 TaxID=1450524 RepID=UPI0006531A33|nr:hypothetical protein [Caenimonas sp. SL110]
MIAPAIALTSYYNPFHGERRRRNYHVFRENLGVPLVTVEWSRDGRFDLAHDDADIMVRVTGGDLMWQKERLLNVGLARIRNDGLARDVAIVDADVVFERADWMQQVSAALDACPLVNCHTHTNYLPELPFAMRSRAQLLGVAPERQVESLGFALAQGKPLFATDAATALAQSVRGVPPSSGGAGIASAVRLDDLPDFECYDGNIVGGGDLLMAAAAIGMLQALFATRPYSAAHQCDAAAWAARCLPAGKDRQRLGFADNRAMHLWHGEMEGRQYGERTKILAPRGYDPARDIDRSGNALRFMQCAGDLKDAVGNYLRSRNDC